MTINLVLCVAVVTIFVTCIVTLWIFYLKLNAQNIYLKESFYHVEKLNKELREQRHDYLNHLQVVYGLIELGEYEELHTYLTPVFKDMMKLSKALKTSKPALNALLKAKRDEAEGKNIDFYVDVKSDLKNLVAEDWELCRVLFNLIDNAITALEEFQGEKMIRIDIMEDKEDYIFSVSNNGPQIPTHMRETIFKQGFSTKQGEGHGMGLSIVMNVIKSYKGSLELESEEETVFRFRLPKEERR